jgi:hypothetical protein
MPDEDCSPDWRGATPAPVAGLRCLAALDDDDALRPSIDDERLRLVLGRCSAVL